MAAITAGGDRDAMPVQEVEQMGYRLVAYGGGSGLPRAVIHAARCYLTVLAAEGTTRGIHDRMLSFSELQALLGTEKMFRLADQYGAGAAPGKNGR